ncbi:hypothetical protein M422DRAFT_247493 [Sphaerobolus stellatus SS14]|nr:hypothetical protein M422DRAFT_247493 [Sphaerobolus stellatus SS14]
MSSILQLNNLTHIALSIRKDPNLSLVVQIVKALLKHESLLIILVRLLRSTSLVLLSGAAEYESIEGRLASIKDNRLFVQRVDVDADPASLLDEWERNARAGNSIWDGVKERMDEKSVKHIF